MDWIINDSRELYLIGQEALSPGDNVYLREGTYELNGNPVYFQGTGEEGEHVNYLPWNNENVIIDGALELIRPYQTWSNIKFTNTDWTTRYTNEIGSKPALFKSVLNSINVQQIAHDITVKDCMFYDCSQGIRCGKNNLIVDGCLFFNIGWLAPDRGHGHAIYWNGDNAIIRNNIFAQGFSGWGLHAYGEQWQTVNNLQAYGNISIDNIFLARALNQPMNNIVMKNNEIWKEEIDVGWTYYENTNVKVKDNYIGNGSLILRNCVDVVDEGNVLAESGGNRIQVMDLGKKLAVVIFNWEELPNVRVDLSGNDLKDGYKYAARNVQDYFGDSFYFTYDENYSNNSCTIKFPMKKRSVAIPYKHDVPLVDSSFPDFGCFVIEEIGRDYSGKHCISPWLNCLYLPLMFGAIANSNISMTRREYLKSMFTVLAATFIK